MDDLNKIPNEIIFKTIKLTLRKFSFTSLAKWFALINNVLSVQSHTLLAACNYSWYLNLKNE